MAILLVLSGCDDAVTPFLEERESFFALHGFLDTAADTQFVRINSLRDMVAPDSLEPLDAIVTSTLVETNEMVVWQDSLIQLDDGSLGHLFFAPFSAVAGGTYRLDVRRADGQRTQATTQVPRIPSLRVGPPQGPALQLRQTVTLEGVFQPLFRLSMHYNVAPAPAAVDSMRNIVIRYTEPGRQGAQGWDVEVFLKRDQNIVLNILNRRFDDTSVGFLGIGAEVEIPSAAWQTPDDPQNIEQGLGFFGSVGRYLVEWKLDTNAVRDIGFVDKQK